MTQNHHRKVQHAARTPKESAQTTIAPRTQRTHGAESSRWGWNAPISAWNLLPKFSPSSHLEPMRALSMSLTDDTTHATVSKTKFAALKGHFWSSNWGRDLTVSTARAFFRELRTHAVPCMTCAIAVHRCAALVCDAGEGHHGYRHQDHEHSY
jgi:hypothetical protein